MELDISKLDIKVSGSTSKQAICETENDFFADMAPIISEAPKFEIESLPQSNQKSSKFDVQMNDDETNAEGWGDWE